MRVGGKNTIGDEPMAMRVEIGAVSAESLKGKDAAGPLRLDYNALKKRLKAVTDGNESVPAFVELIQSVSSPNSECLIELESQHGEKMRKHLKGAALPDPATMGAMFWRNER